MIKQFIPRKALLRVFRTLMLSVCFLITAEAVDASPESFLLPDIRSDHPAIANIDVLIDVGHGGVDGGAVYGSIMEKEINLIIAKKTYDALRKKGLHVLLNRSGDYALSSENQWLHSRSRHIKDLAQRSHLANEVQPKLMISLHVNSAGRPSKRGPLVLHQKNERSKRLATALQRALNPLYGTDETPILGKSYYLLKHTRVPAVIVEMGYITNAADREMLQKTSAQWTIAEKIAEGVNQYIQLQK